MRHPLWPVRFAWTKFVIGIAMVDLSHYQFERWSRQFGNLDLQIYRLSLACKIDLGQTGMVDSVIANTDLSGGKNKSRAFTTMRGLLILRLLMQTKASAELGSLAAATLGHYQLDRLYERIGRQRTDWLSRSAFPR